MAPDEVRRAWAVLGIAPGASVQAVRRRYHQLARRWHPDRFATDPQGQAEAGLEMRRLNAAYRTLLEAIELRSPTRETTHDSEEVGLRQAAADGPTGQRLTREQIEAMVASMGSRSWIGWAIDVIPFGPSLERLFDWLLAGRRVGRWSVAPGAVMASIVVLGYLVLGGLSTVGIDVHGRRLDEIVVGFMVVAGAAAAFAMRERA